MALFPFWNIAFPSVFHRLIYIGCHNLPRYHQLTLPLWMRFTYELLMAPVAYFPGIAVLSFLKR